MIPTWLTGLCADDAPAVLVTVAVVEGSGPREPGAAMAVTRDDQSGTIGGGHLELRACEIARAMLDDPRGHTRLQRFPLGPTLGQCCGGVTHLAFELIGGPERLALRALRDRLLRGENGWRMVPLDTPAPAQLTAIDAPGWPLVSQDAHLLRSPGGAHWLATPQRSPRNRVVLFGAGHVGAALVHALTPLPCRVTWVDARAELFPADLPANVTVEITDTPEAVAEEAPAGAYFLVMTHSHMLDQALAEAILRRPLLHWFGLIGSKTKRMLFEHRLAARGIQPERLARMICPIGLPGIDGKEPAVIAASVCAQLLQCWQHDAQDAPLPAALQTES